MKHLKKYQEFINEKNSNPYNILEISKKHFYQEFINEAKQVGDLYHFTDLISLLGILKTNEIYASDNEETKPAVSFTRDKKNFIKAGLINSKPIRLVIDGNKLSNNYKIVPYQSYLKGTRDEMEERIYKNIKNIKKYIKEITIFNHTQILSNEFEGRDFLLQQKWLKEYIHKDYIDINDILNYLQQYKIKINVL